MTLHTSITKRKIVQKNREGETFEYDRYILHYRDPATGKRRMNRFTTRKEAEAAQQDFIRGADAMKRRKNGKVPTLGEAVEYWLKTKENTITKTTFHAYKQVAEEYIVGPTPVGSARQKSKYKIAGKVPKGLTFVAMLGKERNIEEISTAEIRMWCQRVLKVSGTFNAKLAKKHLSSIFRLIEEDYEVRLARMPTRPIPPHRRKPRALLNQSQVKKILEEAERDNKWGTYYSFLIMTGVRPSEMLALLWRDVDLKIGRIRICRTQDTNGILKDFPKTDAGIREIPINDHLLDLLRDWKKRCPQLNGKPHRVFPAQGRPTGKGRRPSDHSDRGMTLNNFRMRVWYPLLERLDLPKTSLYALRHMAISFLQAQGVEIGLVARLVGHSSPQITLQYYTHPVSDDDGTMEELSAAYGILELPHSSGS